MSFNAALSGIQSASKNLDVIGNNIANVGTVGFKSSRASFSDIYAANALGTSALSIGNGAQLSSVSQLFTQGTVNFTGNNLDLSINGNGFFQLNDKGSNVYSRAGVFQTDQNGYIVNKNGQYLTGRLVDAQGNITGAVGDLQISAANLTPTASSAVSFGLNLPANDLPPSLPWVVNSTVGAPPPDPATFNYTVSTMVYDSLGNEHIMNMYWIKTNVPNNWTSRIQIDGVDVDSSPASAPFDQFFQSNGTFDGSSSTSINLSWSPLNSIGQSNGASSPQTIQVNVLESTQFGSPFSVSSINQNGATTGRLSTVDIGNSGIIFGRYTNGQSKAMGQVLVADFTNANGLQPLGNGIWGQTFSSGPPLVSSPGSGSLGLIQSGALEESNVDLTNELVLMIEAQRNFQANAQTVRALDAVTQTIINLH